MHSKKMIDKANMAVAHWWHFPIIDETIRKARKIVKFIYNHALVLALMRRDFTKGRDFCRPTIIRNIKKGIDVLDPINLENIDLMDWASFEEPLDSLNVENNDNVSLDVDDGGDVGKNILINISNVNPYL
ncbi:uncharacterized protein LOC109018279 [Juglans regia]|uniref:Uncharacterized protein LOC109018279 n=1 Tax=Juglans regia TaxID=51240 RepID=A0A6P9DTH8_JUGRE|nr:uncharacterized protein LOC109018279 [Juglans regia]